MDITPGEASASQSFPETPLPKRSGVMESYGLRDELRTLHNNEINMLKRSFETPTQPHSPPEETEPAGPARILGWQRGGANAFQAMQTQLQGNERYNEANHIRVEPLPSVVKFRTWKNHLRKEVAGASGRPHKTFSWICRADRPQTSKTSPTAGNSKH